MSKTIGNVKNHKNQSYYMPIIPAILAKSKQEYEEQYKEITRFANNTHIDYTTSEFVNNQSITPNQTPIQKTKSEAHLMTLTPTKHIQQLKNKKFKTMIFHYEALKDNMLIHTEITKIKHAKLKAGMAINPNTQIQVITQYAKYLDKLLVMAVTPGKQGQKFQENTYEKIKNIQHKNPNLTISVDGGIKPAQAYKLGQLGIKNVVVGSYITKAENKEENYKEIQTHHKKGLREHEKNKN